MPPEDTITPIAEPAPVAELSFAEAAEKVFGKDSPADAAPASPDHESGKDAGAAPAADAPEVVKQPGMDRAAAKIAAGLRAEKRSAELRRERAELDAKQTQAIAALEQQKAAIAEQVKLVDALKAAKGSPSKALELLGYDARKFITELATENEPAAIAARAVSVEQVEREKLAKEIEALKKERSDEKQQVQTHVQTQAEVAAQRNFLDFVATKAEEYPNTVAEFTPREIVERGWALAMEHGEAYQKKFGVPPDDDVIAEQLEIEAQARAAEKQESAWRERIGKSAPQPRPGLLSGDSRASQPERGPSPRTLSSRQTSQRGSSPRPWTQEGADEESLRILSGAVK